MIEVKLTFSTIAEAAAFLSGAKSANVTAAVSTAGNADKPVAAPKASKTPAPAPTAPAAAAASTDSSKKDAAALDYETEVKPVVLKLAGVPDGGREAVKEVLAEFGVANAKEVPAESRADLVAKLQAKIDSLSVA